MKKPNLNLILLSAILLGSSALAQTAKFDIVTYSAPAGWAVEKDANSIRFSKESGTNYCMISLSRSVDSIGDSAKNFEILWKAMAADGLNASEPQRAKTGVKDGWQAEIGIAPFEKDGLKGAAFLTTYTGNGKVVAVLAITNSDTYQPDIEKFVDSVRLPPIAAKAALPPARQPAEAPQAARKSEFKFNTSNFDDGWTAVEQEDWVRVTKGNITVLLHYPHLKEKEYISDQEEQTRTFWDLLVAPRYTNLKNFELMKYERSHEPGKFAAGNLTDQNGRSVYVVLFSKAKRGWVEIIAPDKNAFTQAFGTYVVNSHDNEWEPLQKLSNYNKFAVAASDLKGKWSTSFSGSLSYVNIYTGASAGMDSYSSSQTFEFGAANTYRWQIATARTAFGSSNFQGAKSAGKFTVPSNWQVHFSDMEGKPKTYPAHFACVKGARILWLDGTSYGKVN